MIDDGLLPWIANRLPVCVVQSTWQHAVLAGVSCMPQQMHLNVRQGQVDVRVDARWVPEQMPGRASFWMSEQMPGGCQSRCQASQAGTGGCQSTCQVGATADARQGQVNVRADTRWMPQRMPGECHIKCQASLCTDMSDMPDEDVRWKSAPDMTFWLLTMSSNMLSNISCLICLTLACRAFA